MTTKILKLIYKPYLHSNYGFFAEMAVAKSYPTFIILFPLLSATKNDASDIDAPLLNTLEQ